MLICPSCHILSSSTQCCSCWKKLFHRSSQSLPDNFRILFREKKKHKPEVENIELQPQSPVIMICLMELIFAQSRGSQPTHWLSILSDPSEPRPLPPRQCTESHPTFHWAKNKILSQSKHSLQRELSRTRQMQLWFSNHILLCEQISEFRTHQE